VNLRDLEDTPMKKVVQKRNELSPAKFLRRGGGPRVLKGLLERICYAKQEGSAFAENRGGEAEGVGKKTYDR